MRTKEQKEVVRLKKVVVVAKKSIIEINKIRRRTNGDVTFLNRRIAKLYRERTDAEKQIKELNKIIKER